MAVIAIAHTPLGSKSLPPLIQFSMVWLLYHKIDELAVIVSARGNRGHAECPLWVISGHFRQSSAHLSRALFLQMRKTPN